MRNFLRKLPSCWLWITSGEDKLSCTIVVIIGWLAFLLYLWRYSYFWYALLFRDNEQLSKYGDTKSARSIMLAELKKLIEANPLFRDKLQFPTLKNSRLRTLINQRSLRSSCLVCLTLYIFPYFNCEIYSFLTFVSLQLQFKLAASALQESEA